MKASFDRRTMVMNVSLDDNELRRAMEEEWNDGYRAGLADGRAEAAQDYETGYQDGKFAGYEEGYDDGYSEGGFDADKSWSKVVP